MNDASSYWTPVCKLRTQLHCWVRAGLRANGTTREGDWGQLLTMPQPSYLEVSGEGPVLLRDVEWVEFSTNRVFGGMAGRPLKMVNIKDELLSALRGMAVNWELRESSWTLERFFEDQPVQVVRVMNPFGPTPTALS